MGGCRRHWRCVVEAGNGTVVSSMKLLKLSELLSRLVWYTGISSIVVILLYTEWPYLTSYLRALPNALLSAVKGIFFGAFTFNPIEYLIGPLILVLKVLATIAYLIVDQLRVVWTLLTLPLFWIAVAITVLGRLGVAGAERGLERAERKAIARL